MGIGAKRAALENDPSPLVMVQSYIRVHLSFRELRLTYRRRDAVYMMQCWWRRMLRLKKERELQWEVEMRWQWDRWNSAATAIARVARGMLARRRARWLRMKDDDSEAAKTGHALYFRALEGETLHKAEALRAKLFAKELQFLDSEELMFRDAQVKSERQAREFLLAEFWNDEFRIGTHQSVLLATQRVEAAMQDAIRRSPPRSSPGSALPLIPQLSPAQRTWSHSGPVTLPAIHPATSPRPPPRTPGLPPFNAGNPTKGDVSWLPPMPPSGPAAPVSNPRGAATGQPFPDAAALEGWSTLTAHQQVHPSMTDAKFAFAPSPPGYPTHAQRPAYVKSHFEDMLIKMDSQVEWQLRVATL